MPLWHSSGMSNARVPVFRSLKTVQVEPGSTKGAVVGTNLFNPDGSLTDLDALIAQAIANAEPDSGIALDDVQANAASPLTVTGSPGQGAFEYGWEGTTTDVPEPATAPVNLYFTGARVLATVLAGLSTATNAVITAADSVLSALGKLQAQVSARLVAADNLSDLADVPTARTNLGLGDLATMDAGNITEPVVVTLPGDTTHMSVSVDRPWSWKSQSTGDFYRDIVEQQCNSAGVVLVQRKIGSWAAGAVCYVYWDMPASNPSTSGASYQFQFHGTTLAQIAGSTGADGVIQAAILSSRDFSGGGYARWRCSTGNLFLDMADAANTYTGEVLTIIGLSGHTQAYWGCPVRAGTFTVAQLNALTGVAEGAAAFATNGLKSGETTGAGTGVPVYFSAAKWRVYRDDSEVGA